jgi:hypothetical protein
VRDIEVVGARAAASNSVWYPSSDAYLRIESGTLLLVTFDAPVIANKELCESLGWQDSNILCERISEDGRW